MKSAIEDEIVTLAQASKLTGFSKTWISKMVDSGHVQRCAPGKFKLGPLILGVIAFGKAERKATPKSPNQERIFAARAEALEIANREKKGELCDVDDTLLFVDRVFVPLKQDIIGLGASVTRDPALRRKIEDAVNALLQRASDRMDVGAKRLKKMIDDNEPDADEQFNKED